MVKFFRFICRISVHLTPRLIYLSCLFPHSLAAVHSSFAQKTHLSWVGVSRSRPSFNNDGFICQLTNEINHCQTGTHQWSTRPHPPPLLARFSLHPACDGVMEWVVKAVRVDRIKKPKAYYLLLGHRC